MTATDAHIHIQPFHMMPREIAATFWKGKPNRAELEAYAADPRALLARMDADGIARCAPSAPSAPHRSTRGTISTFSTGTSHIFKSTHTLFTCV